MSAIIKRDIRVALRSGGAWLLGFVFFALFLTVSVIAMGSERSKLAEIGPALIWISVLFSALLSYEGIFGRDMADGTLEQLRLSPISGVRIVTAKACSFMIVSILPIIVALPLAAILIGLTPAQTAGLALSIACAAPAIASYGTLTSAVMSRPRSGGGGGGFLIILMATPFLLPVLIFGLSAVESYVKVGMMATEFQALIGLSLIGCAVAIPAASAAITANLE